MAGEILKFFELSKNQLLRLRLAGDRSQALIRDVSMTPSSDQCGRILNKLLKSNNFQLPNYMGCLMEFYTSLTQLYTKMSFKILKF
jgi:hypothetical protein